jgi:limonene 1,2-monooxygenase
MKYAFFMMPLHLPTENPSLAFERDIDLINYVDKLGYDEFYIGEHHSAAWETIPAPEMILAKASATATNITLGTSVTGLPFHHPFNIAERFVFLDHLTRGKAVLGVGPSSLPTDVQLYDIPAQDLNPMMQESVEIIVQLLESDEPVTYKGKYWDIRDMYLQFKSYRQPRLKLATASVGSERSLEIAARYEMILFSIAAGGPPNAIPISEQWAKMEEYGEKHGTNPTRDDWRIVTYVHLADTREEAWDQVRKGMVRDVHDYFYTINTPQGWLITPDQDPASLSAEDIVSKRRWIIGTPEDAIEEIQKMYDETGGFGGLMIGTHEWVPQVQIEYSLELFARYVMPHFRGHTQPLVKAWERTMADRANGKIPALGGPPTGAPSVDDHKSNIFVNR